MDSAKQTCLEAALKKLNSICEALGLKFIPSTRTEESFPRAYAPLGAATVDGSNNVDRQLALEEERNTAKARGPKNPKNVKFMTTCNLCKDGQEYSPNGLKSHKEQGHGPSKHALKNAARRNMKKKK